VVSGDLCPLAEARELCPTVVAGDLFPLTEADVVVAGDLCPMEVEEEEEWPTEIVQKSLMLQVKYMLKEVGKWQGRSGIL
jgi:hypothetical protein